MQTSDQGLQMIKTFEGCRLHAYQDTRGIWTIGYGHTGPEVVEGLVITQNQAEQLLATRLANEFEPAVNEAVNECPVETEQNKYDAMVCLAYNIGAHAFSGSSVKNDHIRDLFTEAADAFLMWKHPPELLNRRQKERECYLMGVYP